MRGPEGEARWGSTRFHLSDFLRWASEEPRSACQGSLASIMQSSKNSKARREGQRALQGGKRGFAPPSPTWSLPKAERWISDTTVIQARFIPCRTYNVYAESWFLDAQCTTILAGTQEVQNVGSWCTVDVV